MSTATIDYSAGITVRQAAGTRGRASRAHSLRGLIAATLRGGAITSPFVEESGDLSRPQRFWAAQR